MRKFAGISRFPLGFWNYMDIRELGDKALADWEEAAFSCILSPFYTLDGEDREKLDILLRWCAEHKVNIILRDPRVSLQSIEPGVSEKMQLPADYDSRVAEAVAEFAGHPQVYGFFILDEPHVNHYEAVVQAVRTVKKHSDRLLPFVNLLPAMPSTVELLQFRHYDRYLADYAKRTGAQQVCYDYYGQMTERNEENSQYYVNLNHYRNLSREGVEFWTTLLSTPHFNYRRPSYDDLRWQVNTSLAYGAKGILYFTFYTPDNAYNSETNYRQGPIDWWGERTDTFYGIRDVNRELHQRWGDLFLELQLLQVGHYPEAPAKELNTVDYSGPVKEIEILTGHEPRLILSDFRHSTSGQPYVFIVNANPRDSIQVQVHLEGVRRLRRFNAYGEAYDVDNPAPYADILQSKFWLAPGQGELVELVRTESAEF